MWRKKATIMESGEIIYYDPNYLNNGYASVCIAAPITIAGTPYYMGVIVIRYSSGDRFYTHDVMLVEKQETDLPLTPGPSDDGTPGGTSVSMDSILRMIKEVKRQSTDRRFSFEDEDLDLFDEPAASAFSKYVDEDGAENSFQEGTQIMKVRDSEQFARTLRNQYGSNAGLKRLATMSRQMSDTASVFTNVWAGMQMYELDSSDPEITSRISQADAELAAMSEEIAEEIIEGAERGADYDAEMHQYLIDTIKGNKIQIPADQAKNYAEALGFESLGEARKATGFIGRYMSTQNGMPVDTLYALISETYPGLVRQGILAPEDQLRAIYDAFQNTMDTGAWQNHLARTMEERRENKEAIAARAWV